MEEINLELAWHWLCDCGHTNFVRARSGEVVGGVESLLDELDGSVGRVLIAGGDAKQVESYEEGDDGFECQWLFADMAIMPNSAKCSESAQ